MNKTFRMTSGELISLSIVAVVAGAIAVALLLRNCSGSGRSNGHEQALCDSITSAIENRAVKHDSTKTAVKSKRKKTLIKTNKVKEPKQRNYLDEPANE